MTNKKVLLVTGAGRGLGVDIAKAALAAGFAVVATGRDPESVEKAVGAAEALITLSASGELPLRFVAGADAMAGVEQNLDTVRGQIDAHRDLSASLSCDA